jgi:hypothetical protein
MYMCSYLPAVLKNHMCMERERETVVEKGGSRDLQGGVMQDGTGGDFKDGYRKCTKKST